VLLDENDDSNSRRCDDREQQDRREKNPIHSIHVRLRKLGRWAVIADFLFIGLRRFARLDLHDAR